MKKNKITIDEKISCYTKEISSFLDKINHESHDISEQIKTINSTTLNLLLKQINKLTNEFLERHSEIISLNEKLNYNVEKYNNELKQNVEEIKNSYDLYVEEYNKADILSKKTYELGIKLSQRNLIFASKNQMEYNKLHVIISFQIISFIHLNVLTCYFAFTFNDYNKFERIKNSLFEASTSAIGMLPGMSEIMSLYEFPKQVANIVNSFDDDFIKREINENVDSALLKLEKQIEILNTAVNTQEQILNLIKNQLYHFEMSTEERKKR